MSIKKILTLSESIPLIIDETFTGGSFFSS